MADGWMPIETEPLDGRQVLLYMPGGICIAPSAPRLEGTHQDKLRAFKETGEFPDYRKWTPTHWMPLPEPPA